MFAVNIQQMACVSSPLRSEVSHQLRRFLRHFDPPLPTTPTQAFVLLAVTTLNVSQTATKTIQYIGQNLNEILCKNIDILMSP